MLAVHHLPEVLDPGRVLADEQRAVLARAGVRVLVQEGLQCMPWQIQRVDCDGGGQRGQRGGAGGCQQVAQSRIFL